MEPEKAEPGATAQRPQLSRPVRAHVSRQPGSWLTWDVGRRKMNPPDKEHIKDLPTETLIELAQNFASERPFVEYLSQELAKRRHNESMKRLDELRNPHWTVQPNFWITVVSAVAAVLAAYFAWLAVRPAATPLPPAISASPANSLSKPLPVSTPPKP